MNRLLALVLALASVLAFGQPQAIPNRYIVEFDAAPALEGFRAGRHRVAAAEFAAARTRVRNGQRTAIRAMQGKGGRLLHQYDSILNGVAVEISDARAAELMNLPGVKSVRPDYAAKALLDRALPIHKIPEAWNNLPGGADSAGLGMKVAVVDTGVDVRHPGFVDDTRPPLEGYPKFGNLNEEIDRPLISSKIIVMRAYQYLVDRNAGTRLSATDSQGHGTGVAMAAVGKRIDGPYGPISGAAPGAYLGVYRLTPDGEGGTSTVAILAALDDAVRDGMDVINLSFGNSFGPDGSNDAALLRIAEAGVIFVAAIGNSGPGYQSTGWPGNSPHVIGVGASGNDRLISTTAVITAGDFGSAGYVGSNSRGSGKFTAPLQDSANLNNELACDPFPADSLRGSIILILRGICTFETKLNYAKQAGAIAGIVYNPVPSETSVAMLQNSNHLPAVWLNYDPGIALKAKLRDNPGLIATVDTIPTITPDTLASFSAMGPSNGSLQIKPDLVAVGENFVTAAPISCCGNWPDEAGDALTPGFIALGGTSFSSPIVAGAAAILKQSRPGLTQRQYRSLLTNSARALPLPAKNREAIPFEAGAGKLDLAAAQRANAAVWPVSLSFGGGGKNPSIARTLTITNLGTEPDTFSIRVAPIDDSAQPSLPTASITLNPNDSNGVPVNFSGNDLRTGNHHGYLIVSGTKSDVELRVPYWYGIASSEPGSIAYVSGPTAAVAGGSRVQIVFQVTDTSGQTLDGAAPTIEAITDGGRVDSIDPDVNGNGRYRAAVRPGRASGNYFFRIRAGGVSLVFGMSVE